MLSVIFINTVTGNEFTLGNGEGGKGGEELLPENDLD